MAAGVPGWLLAWAAVAVGRPVAGLGCRRTGTAPGAAGLGAAAGWLAAGRLTGGRLASGTAALILPGHQIAPLAAVTPADVQTFAGLAFVVLQMAAVIRLAAPSTPLAIGLEGFLSAAATWLQVAPASTCGL